MTLLIEEEIQIPFTFDYKQVARQVVEQALESEDFPYETEVSLTLTGLDEIHEINREFRDMDRPTDVLSFPQIDYPAPGDFSKLEDSMDIFNPDSGECILGDIVLCVPKVVSQAEEFGHSVMREYAFLIAHSMLHLMGYDHMEDAERLDMEARQEAILRALHIDRTTKEEQ
ncbi:MAG: rRNA maturation RNase YbeY [Lachnospiraceae bacterium]|nr:rRNA maturation RNase YbeY [Lachnospiraceae bacterium]